MERHNNVNSLNLLNFIIQSKCVILFFFIALIGHFLFRQCFSYLNYWLLDNHSLAIIEKTYYVTRSVFFSYILMLTLFVLVSFIFSKGYLYEINRPTLVKFSFFVITFYTLLILAHVFFLLSTQAILEWIHLQEESTALMLTTIARAICPIVIIPFFALMISLNKRQSWTRVEYPPKYYRNLNIILFTLISWSLTALLSGPIFWLSHHSYIFIIILLIPAFCAYKLFPSESQKVEVNKIILSTSSYVIITMLVFPIIFSFCITTIPFMLYLYSFSTVSAFMYIIMFIVQYIICRKSIKIFFRSPLPAAMQRSSFI